MADDQMSDPGEPRYSYPDEQTAALGLLGEVSTVLATQIVDFVVIGGWLPFLFNSSPIAHPGTFDVDILLNEATSRSTFERAAQSLLQIGLPARREESVPTASSSCGAGGAPGVPRRFPSPSLC